MSVIENRCIYKKRIGYVDIKVFEQVDTLDYL